MIPAPGNGRWEDRAVAWLFDVIPPGYREHAILREHPAALVFLARHHVNACLEGSRHGYRTVRTELSETLPPHRVNQVLAAYREEGIRLSGIARAVDLIDRAMRGEAFTPKA